MRCRVEYTLIKVLQHFVFDIPPFIVALPYDQLYLSHSQQLTYEVAKQQPTKLIGIYTTIMYVHSMCMHVTYMFGYMHMYICTCNLFMVPGNYE